MRDIWIRIMENYSLRFGGPIKFSFVMQRLVALIFAIIAGSKDAKAGKGPNLWSFFWEPQHRFPQQETVYPRVALIVAFLLAILPYLMVLGLLYRLAPKCRTDWRGLIRATPSETIVTQSWSSKCLPTYARI